MAIEGLSHLVVGVSDVAAARGFYVDVLGFEPANAACWPGEPDGVVLKAGTGHLILKAQPDRPDLTATGVHQAYAVNRPVREAISARLTACGIELHTYKEDCPSEANEPLYFSDPDGNRIQLVLRDRASTPALDHVGLQVANLIAGEWFYSELFAWPVEHRVGWRTADYVQAQQWAEGKEAMAPGTRRLDKRYTVMVNRKTVARPNMQAFIRCGTSSLALYLANQHFQEPPEDQLIGAPRTAFRASPAAIDLAMERLASEDLPYHGPVRHPAGSPIGVSLYFRDPGGNFLELATPA